MGLLSRVSTQPAIGSQGWAVYPFYALIFKVFPALPSRGAYH